jgi:hypothetical protein
MLKDLKSKARRDAAKAEETCQKCFRRIPMPGKTVCGYCAEKAEEYKAASRARRKGEARP